MAELILRGDRFSLRYYDPSGQRKTVTLNTKSERKANRLKLYIEDLVSSQVSGGVLDPGTSAWLAALDPRMVKRLAKCGLVQVSEQEVDTSDLLTLEEMLQRYFDRRTDVKPATLIKWRHAQRNLLEHFGADRPITSITAGDAKDFERYLKTEARKIRYGDKSKSDGLSGDTVRKRICDSKQFFQDAVDRELIRKNPFAGLKSATQGNAERFHFIDRETASKVLEACPNDQWRLVFALARYGGLRCPSELLLVRLDEIDWANDKFLVHAPKTEHHRGKASRWVPIFPELREHFFTAAETAGTGQEYLVTIGRERSGAYFRTGLMKILKRAGLVVWTKLFQNLRSTRQTELENEFPSHVVCAWLGNSPKVAAKHYLQVTDDHFAAAVTGSENVAFFVAHPRTEGPFCAQNAPIFAPVRTGHDSPERPRNPGKTTKKAVSAGKTETAGVGDAGLETMPETLEKTTSDPARSHFVAYPRTEGPHRGDVGRWLDCCPIDLSQEQRAEILKAVTAETID